MTGPARGAFSYPNYRRYWISTVAMVFAMQFRFIGAAWLVHELTDSPFWLGVPGIISAAVSLLLMLPAGTIADRVDTQRLLALGRALAGVAHLALAILTVTGVVRVWMVLVWAAVTAAFGALTGPSANALLPRLIDRSAMASAVALNGAVWSGMRIIGPAAAGLVIATVGIGPAFFVTAAGFALATFLIATLELAPLRREAGAQDSGMLGGVRYVLRNRIFLATIGLSFFTSMFGSSYVVLLPIFADDVLHAGVQGFGYLEAAAGSGALLGTLSIMRIRTGRYTGAVMVGAAVMFGLWIAGFSASRSLSLSMALLFAGGFSSAVYLNVGMTTLQLLVPEELRGRVMAIWGLTWLLSSAGGFVAASIASFLGAPFAIALGALAVSGFAVFVYVIFEEVRGIPTPA
ncbi:MAG: MFS transporter [Myxococcota bacterium]